jgi:UDP-N-acetylglucosamine 2-epimerase
VIVTAFGAIGETQPVVWAVHPRTRERVGGLELRGVTVIEPRPYLDTQALVRFARVVLTDSGGLQKEASFLGTPCVILRDRTEWVELIDAGASVLAGADARRIVEATSRATWPASGLPPRTYGSGRAAEQIARIVLDRLSAHEDGEPCAGAAREGARRISGGGLR